MGRASSRLAAAAACLMLLLLLLPSLVAARAAAAVDPSSFEAAAGFDRSRTSEGHDPTIVLVGELADSERATRIGPRALSFRHDHFDVFGGHTRLHYSATLHAHVHTLDSIPLVLGVTCDGAGDLTISLADVRVAEAWLSDMPRTLLAGVSETFACKNGDGRAGPFTRRLLSVRTAVVGEAQVDGTLRPLSLDADPSLLDDLARWDPEDAARPGSAAPAVLTFETEEAEGHECFEELTVDFHRIKGLHEDELRAAMRANETHARRMQWSFISGAASSLYGAASSAASSVYGAASSAASSAYGAVSSAASAVASGGAWGDSETYSYTMMNWNYDADSGTPASASVPLVGSSV
jgi:hypothetical protein